jgi:acetylornithine deacetylase/succinyl-diaminopimelate desuccinylase-like protein
MRRVIASFAILFAFGIPSLLGQELTKKELLSEVRQYRRAHESEIIEELRQLLSIPNESNDPHNVAKNATFIRGLMEKRGIETRVFETPGNPILFGEVKVPGATQTLMFYIHYDGQPVQPSKWTDSEPFSPVLRPGKLIPGTRDPSPIDWPPPGASYDEDWRIYARSASDDKGPLIPLLTALDFIRSAGIPLKSNLKFLLDGEEEAGSPNLHPWVEEHEALMRSDVLFICDGPVYYSGEPTLWFGNRGSTTVEITVYGPNTTLHSGHFGNWAPNPVLRLVQLLATMKDENGKVTIEGYYDSSVPLSKREEQALMAVPPYDEHLKDLYGFALAEGGGMSLLEAIQWPSFNLRAVETRGVGTAIPRTATATIGIRLVKGNTPRYMLERIVEHVEAQGYHVVDQDPDHETRMKYPLLAKVEGGGGYPASRTSMDLPIAERVIDVLTGYYETDPVLVPSMGASIQMHIFTEELGIPVIFAPTVNHDNNQHGPDENIRIGHLWTAIETFAAFMAMDGE